MVFMTGASIKTLHAAQDAALHTMRDARIVEIVRAHDISSGASSGDLGSPRRTPTTGLSACSWSRRTGSRTSSRVRSAPSCPGPRCTFRPKRTARGVEGRRTRTPTAATALIFGPGTDELVERHRARALLDAILDAMPVNLRAVLVLFEIEGLTMSEIADALVVPAGTVASRLRRARAELETQVLRYRTHGTRGGTSS